MEKKEGKSLRNGGADKKKTKDTVYRKRDKEERRNI
jgi:hypothetical protein